MGKTLLGLVEEQHNIYVLYNNKTEATIECTQGYLTQWLARGFKVVEIKLGDVN